jgi:hypothetical protein
MNAKSAGVLVGIVIGLIVSFFAIKFFNRDGKIRTEYDEMQEIIRGKAYRIAFFTLVIALAILLVLDIMEVALPMTNSVLYFGLIVIGIAVQAGYSILNGAYFGLNNNKAKFWGVMITVTVINLLVSIMAIVSGRMVVDGKLQDPCINLLCAALFGVIAIFSVIPKKADEE